MRAIVMESFGGPEVLKLAEVPAPDPAPDEVVVAVEAVSINRSFDLLVRRDGNDRNIVLPHVLGADPAGTVAEVGAAVTEFAPGDRVAVSSTIRCGRCRECVEVARSLGGRVIAAAGADRRVEAALALGADHGVDYRGEDLRERVREITGGEGVDVVCENIGDPELWDAAFDCLAQRGRLVTMGAHGGGRVALDIRKLYGRRLRVIGSAGVTRRNVDDALAAAAEGGLAALIDSIHPLEAAAAQHRRLEQSGSVVGKVILDPTVAA